MGAEKGRNQMQDCSSRYLRLRGVFKRTSFLLIGWPVGLEPTTSRATTWRSNQLNYGHRVKALLRLSTKTKKSLLCLDNRLFRDKTKIPKLAWKNKQIGPSLVWVMLCRCQVSCHMRNGQCRQSLSFNHLCQGSKLKSLPRKSLTSRAAGLEPPGARIVSRYLLAAPVANKSFRSN
jgi:hypothetical protein